MLQMVTHSFYHCSSEAQQLAPLNECEMITCCCEHLVCGAGQLQEDCGICRMQQVELPDYRLCWRHLEVSKQEVTPSVSRCRVDQNKHLTKCSRSISVHFVGCVIRTHGCLGDILGHSEGIAGPEEES